MIATDISESVLSRAQGCLLGQLAGDSLGSIVESKDARTIQALYPNGVRELADGGVWNTLAGQPTDDSEMAFALARSLVRNKEFSIDDVRESYVRWYRSRPFDIGKTTAFGLEGDPTLESQANGALMRVSPLGIFGWRMEPEALAKLAAEDAKLTHPNPICRQVNGLYATAIAEAIREGYASTTVYDRMTTRAEQWNVNQAIRVRIEEAHTRRPPEYYHLLGWVLTAFQNALHELPARHDARGSGHRDGAAGAIPTRLAQSAEPYSGPCTGATPCRDSGWTASSSAGPQPRRRNRDRRNTGPRTRCRLSSAYFGRERRKDEPEKTRTGSRDAMHRRTQAAAHHLCRAQHR